MRREYQTGTKWCVWRWKDILWDGELYLRRLHIFQCPLGAVMLHFFHAPDRQRHIHDHPVSMLTIFLRGWYVENRNNLCRVKKYFNWIPATPAHRIIATSNRPKPITLAICGPRVREWGFHTEHGWIPWKQYHKIFEGSTS